MPGSTSKENSIETSQKLKIGLLYDLVILLFNIYSKNTKIYSVKSIFIPSIYYSIIYNNEDLVTAHVVHSR